MQRTSKGTAEHPRTCPGTIPADGSYYLYLDYAELRHDSHQWDVRPREPSRQHESRLLIRVGDDSIGWEGTPARPCRQLRGCPGSPSDPGLLRNRAPDRPAPVTARSDMRRRLTAPARTGHPRTIATGSRPVPRSRPPVPGQRRPGHGGESAGDGRAQTMPASRQPGRGGAGRPEDRVLPPAGGRAPPPAGTGRSSAAGPGIASRPNPVAGISGHGARTSGGRGRRRTRQRGI